MGKCLCYVVTSRQFWGQRSCVQPVHDFLWCDESCWWYCSCCFLATKSHAILSKLIHKTRGPSCARMVLKLQLAQAKGHTLAKFRVGSSKRPLFACSACGSYVVEQFRSLSGFCMGRGRGQCMHDNRRQRNTSGSVRSNKRRRLFVNSRHPRT